MIGYLCGGMISVKKIPRAEMFWRCYRRDKARALYMYITVFVDTFEKKTPAETFPTFPSIIQVIDRSDQNPPITARWHDAEKV